MSDNTFDLSTVIDDAKKVITNPVGFYREMPTEGGYANPIIFIAVMAAVTGLMVAIFSVIGLGGGVAMAGAVGFAAIFMVPIFVIVGSFIGAAILFVIWKLMGSEKDYEVAYRCAAYSTAILPIITVVSIIPYLGIVVRALWSFFLMTTASVEVHKLSAQTSKIVFGVLFGLMLLLSLSAENSSRNMQSKWKEATSNAEVFENMEDMTAEEAGEKVGEFLKGFEKVAREMEEARKKEEEKED